VEGEGQGERRKHRRERTARQHARNIFRQQHITRHASAHSPAGAKRFPESCDIVRLSEQPLLSQGEGTRTVAQVGTRSHLFRMRMMCLWGQRFLTYSSTCAQRVPRGSRTSSTWAMTSLLSTTCREPGKGGEERRGKRGEFKEWVGKRRWPEKREGGEGSMRDLGACGGSRGS